MKEKEIEKVIDKYAYFIDDEAIETIRYLLKECSKDEVTVENIKYAMDYYLKISNKK